MSNQPHDAVPLAQLREAVARGIITTDQLAALQELNATGAPTAEAQRGLNAVTVAYGLGAAAVLIALGWFIVDRWEALGPGGILVVSLVYALLFALTSRVVGRLGFRTAAAIAALLAVSMAPVVIWGLLNVLGWWYQLPPTLSPQYAEEFDVLYRLRWLPITLGTALAALVTLRRVHFGLLALPAAMTVPAIVNEILPLLLPWEAVSEMGGWGAFVAGIVLITTGYVVERRSHDDEDYARWIYLTGLVTLAAGVLMVWNWSGALRHGLPVLAVALFTLSLFLRRPMFAVFGSIGLVAYLGYLAFDVFREALSFPIVLASFGIAVIVLTVWVQRRYPALARQVEEQRRGQRSVPNAVMVFGGAVVIAVGLAASRIPAAREQYADRWVSQRRAALRAQAAQRRQKTDSAKLGVPAPGKAPPARR